MTRPLLRFITCGSVDDGKSTLIGRLLWDSKSLPDDQAATVEGGDYARLLDGLQAEREQGITIDVAYRYFATSRRTFIVADTPGHEQYTRNMATGASAADLAVILVDARKGVLVQTRRHCYLAALLGIRQIVLAVNKMDLVGYDQARFDETCAEFCRFADPLGLSVTAIPVAAALGANVAEPSGAMPWYGGPTLLAHLEEIDVAGWGCAGGVLFPVQLVCRPHADFRGYAGTLARGVMHPGDRVVVLPSGRESRIDRIVTMTGDLPMAAAGDAVTITLTDEVDVSRGDLLASPDCRPPVADQYVAELVWLADEPLLPGRQYLFKHGPNLVTGRVSELKHRVDINTMRQLPAKTLALNEIGRAAVALDRPVPFAPYRECRDTGNFIVIDRYTNATVGAGMIDHPLRRAENVHWHATAVERGARARLKGQKPLVVWFTGLSGSGKSTVANLVEHRLHALGRHTYLLDGDNVRHGLCRDLGFTAADRVENMRRVAEVARIIADAGLIVLVAFISPFRDERDMARGLMPPGEFVEIYLDTPLEICEQRDPKGLYQKARSGTLTNFTGIDSPYEPPLAAELTLGAGSAEEQAGAVLAAILKQQEE